MYKAFPIVFRILGTAGDFDGDGLSYRFGSVQRLVRSGNGGSRRMRYVLVEPMYNPETAIIALWACRALVRLSRFKGLRP